jgi:hypothetical protein
MTPLDSLKAGLQDLLDLPDPFDLQRRRNPASTSGTVLALQGGITHPDASQYQLLRLTLTIYHPNEGTAYDQAVALYDTLTMTFGPAGSCANTWSLDGYLAQDLVAQPPIPLGPLGDKPVTYAVSIPLSLRLSAAPAATP